MSAARQNAEMLRIAAKRMFIPKAAKRERWENKSLIHLPEGEGLRVFMG